MWQKRRLAPAVVSLVVIAACSGGSGGELAIYLAPTDLPPGFEMVHWACIEKDRSGKSLASLGYRSDDRYTTEERAETALLRIFAFEGDRTDELLDQVDEGSVVASEVRGVDGWRFTITSAEPVPLPWPAILWHEGDVTVEIVGEGLKANDVKVVADGIEFISRADFEGLDPDPPC